ncbi:MAG: N-formylglutamate amidohydrolase [Novosphingobium sp.]
MTRAASGPGESPRRDLGCLPGTADEPAFALWSPQPSSVPVLIAVPHAGRAYPAELTARMRHPRAAALRLEDRYADLLGREVARRTGAALLVANAPRAMIDLNRADDDVDWDMLVRGSPDRGARPIGLRARSGLGLIPRRIHGLGEIWKQRLTEEELAGRIAAIHTPYHTALAGELARLRKRWGAALLIDLHSMPPLGLRGPRPPSVFVVGDRFGVSCHGTLVAAAFGYFNEVRREAGHNRPYAGGYVLERHAAPDDGVHGLQIEVDRSCYLDHALTEPGPGFAAVVDVLAGLTERLASRVAELGQADDAGDWAVAAE